MIPKQVYIQGTIRSHHDDVREQIWEEIDCAFKLSENFNGRYQLTIHEGYPALYNDPDVNDWMRNVARDLAGEEHVIADEFGMGAEDFAYMAQEAKGAMFMLGAAIDDGIMRNHHTDIFNIDESVMPTGAAVLAETARRFVMGKYETGD